MKTMKTIRLLLAFITSICFTSCVEDGDFTVPQEVNTQENTAVEKIIADLANPNSGVTEISIANVKGLFVSGQVTEITSDIVVKGYVSSSDFSGNFYKEFYIQDAPENPTTAIKIATEFVDSYNKYNFGREIYIQLKGLFIGETRAGDGVIAIGGQSNATADGIENLSLNQTNNQILRTKTSAEIVPLRVTFSQINEQHIGVFVKIENAQFSANVAGKTFVEATDQFDTQRMLESCEGFGFSNFILETSTFAIFKFAVIPSGGGSIAAVVTKTFNGNAIVLVVNNNTDVVMENERCTPLDSSAFSPIFMEDFNATFGNININGWFNFTEQGTKPWQSYIDADTSSRAARVGSFNSNNISTISWLITKGINLDATSQEFLSFETSNSFSNGSELEALISTNFNGSTSGITTATWKKLPAKIVSDSEFFRNWVHSGYVNLSAYTGTAYIAFKYTGSGDAAFDGTFELDNIVIKAK